MELEPESRKVPTPPLHAATQTFPHTATSRDVSTQLSFREFLASPSTHDVLCPTCARPVPSLPLDTAVQTPLHSVATHDASTQLPLTEFFIGCILSNDPLDRQACHRHIAVLEAPHHLNLLTLLRFVALAAPAMLATVTSTPRLHMSYCSHHRVSEKYARQHASHGFPVKAAPVRPRLCASIPVTPPQSHVSITHVGTHPVRSAATYKRSASTGPCGNPQSCWCRSSCRKRSFPLTTSPCSSYGQIWSIQT